MSEGRLAQPAAHFASTTAAESRAGALARAWQHWTPIIVSVICSFVFVARTAFQASGATYFTLFDDAMISMRYARNLAEGHGLLWNPGQPPVEGYTNFLWTLWMALLHLLPVPESKIALTVMCSGALILVLNLVVVRKIVAHLDPDAPLAASLAVWLTALYYPLIYWTLRGMEVGLVTLIVSLCVLLALRLRTRVRAPELIGLGALIALGILTRPDVLVPGVVIAGFVVGTARAESRRVVAAVLLGSIVGTLAVHTTFRMWYYDAPLPNTYYLKVIGSTLAARVSRGLLGLFVLDLFHLIVPVALSAGYLVARHRKARGDSGGLLLAAIFVALAAYSVYVGGDAWDDLRYANRYLTPAMPGLLILSALAINDFLSPAPRPHMAAVQGLASLFLLVSLICLSVPITIQDIVITPFDERLRIGRAAVTLAPVLALGLLFVPRPSGSREPIGILTAARRRSIVAVVLAVASLVAINGHSAGTWISHNAAYVEDDAWATRYGLALRAATTDDATIAVTWGGAIPYFSHRPTIDLLGKSDRVIATLARHPAVDFNPGHDKWNYDYSIGRLRPDVVAQLWHPSEAELRTIESQGYMRLGPWTFARADSTRIDLASLKEGACDTLGHDPFVLGSVQRSVANLQELRRQYCR